MCTRFHLTEEHYRRVLRELGIPAPAAYVTRYNIAPGRPIPAVRDVPGPVRRETVGLRWGLTPNWAKSDESESRLVNARAETLAEKPSFRDALRSRRCVIPATGFFEWESVGRAKKPWLFQRADGEPFVLAGLWEAWRAPDGEIVESCAVVTTAPNEVMRPIHHRMPVMLTLAQCGVWLDRRRTRAEELAPLLQSPPAATMTALAVNPRVSNVQHDDPACIAPAPAAAANGRDDEPQLSLGF